MRTFIEDYLQNPANAISAASRSVNQKSWADEIDEELIWQQISSPEFRLYEEIIFSQPLEDRPVINTYPVVA